MDERDLLFDVEVVGAAALKRSYPDAVSVFVLPPSLAELERRLRSRGTEDEAVVARRLSVARRELLSADTFDHLVVNEDVETAAADLRAILRATGLRTSARRALLDRLRATV
jgi:guanylate kinase